MSYIDHAKPDRHIIYNNNVTTDGMAMIDWYEIIMKDLQDSMSWGLQRHGNDGTSNMEH